MDNNNISILIVDDEQTVRQLLVEWLSPHYSCVSAASVGEAAELLTRYTFNLVITDILLPVGSGIDVCEIIRRVAPYTAIVAMSGSPSIHHQTEALRQGALFYVKKPFDLLEMQVLIESTLSHQTRFVGRYDFLTGTLT
jgi:DNA-binding NtrC family response regulator